MAPNAEGITLRVIYGAGVEGCAAIAAEGMAPLVAAFGSLHVSLWHAGTQHEIRCWSSDDSAVGSSGERLTVGAVTNEHCVRINLGFIGDLSTMAASINFHSTSPRLSSARLTTCHFAVSRIAQSISAQAKWMPRANRRQKGIERSPAAAGALPGVCLSYQDSPTTYFTFDQSSHVSSGAAPMACTSRQTDPCAAARKHDPPRTTHTKFMTVLSPRG